MMDIYGFIELADQYADLGGAVQSQLSDVANDTDTMGDQNPNALREIAKFLKALERHDIDGADVVRKEIEKFLDNHA